MWLDPQELASSRDRLAELAAEQGRPAPGVALVAFVNVCDDRASGEADSAELIRRQYGLPYERVKRWTLVGSADEIAERLATYVKAGVEGFCLSPAHPRPIEQVHALAEVRGLLSEEMVAR
jgi:alkanesulfonate monooxygenase SsuD/methylene tetrahydromethanopterin reductase-like flavin-dependent oxidoreductase (luciferase family)